MKTNLYLTFLGAALLAAPVAFGQGGGGSATSGVVGFSTKSVASGTSIVVPTLVNSSVFQGSVTISSDGLTVTPSTAPGWVVGVFSATSFGVPTPNYPTHYAEVVSGTHEGLLLDISTNSATSLTLAAPAPSVVRNTTQQVSIRAHVTLSKIVEGATGLAPGDDVVTIFDASTGGRRDFTYVGGTNFTASGLSANHAPVYPGNGIIFNATDTVTLNFMGEVKPTKTQIPLWATGTNVVGTMNPASSTLLYGNSLATLLAPGDDVITVYSTNGQMIPSNYTSNGSAIGNSGGLLGPTATDALPINSGAVITVADPLTWIINSPLNP